MAAPPSQGACWHRLLAAHPPAWVPGHCRCVAGLAVAMADAAASRGLAVDRARVAAGAILHDIGRSVTQDVRHAGLGADLLRGEGWDATVVRIVETHTGGGIDADEAKALGLPVKDYTPRTLEERIVCHADNLYSAERRLTLAQLEAKYQAKGLPAAWQKIHALHAQLTRELGVDLERLAPAALELPGTT